jgi:hypothetical protein
LISDLAAAGITIEGYEVQVREICNTLVSVHGHDERYEFKSTNVLKPDITSFLLADLKPVTDWVCRIKAVTSHGDTDFSSPSDIVRTKRRK